MVTEEGRGRVGACQPTVSLQLPSSSSSILVYKLLIRPCQEVEPCLLSCPDCQGWKGSDVEMEESVNSDAECRCAT